MTNETKIEDEVSAFKETMCPETMEFVSRCFCPECSRIRRMMSPKIQPDNLIKLEDDYD